MHLFCLSQDGEKYPITILEALDSPSFINIHLLLSSLEDQAQTSSGQKMFFVLIDIFMIKEAGDGN